MRILAIDPGTTRSGWVIYVPATHTIDDCGVTDNESLIRRFRQLRPQRDMIRPVIEQVASYGRPVGREVFETCFWTGRFLEAFEANTIPPAMMTRIEVKKLICHHHMAKDPHVRQAVIDRFPASGGGSRPQIGTKAQPGPLYGVTKDAWQALALALAWCDQRAEAVRAEAVTP